MKLKIDENLSRAHRRLLASVGHDVSDVHDEHLSGARDEVLWSAVCDEGRLLITLDTDFADVRRFAPGQHPGILLVRTTHPSLAGVSAILQRVFDECDLAELAGCLAVADETRTRVRRP